MGEDDYYSTPVTVDLNSLFSNLSIVQITEMTLTGNTPLSELSRLQWNTDSEAPSPKFIPTQDGLVVLNPMDIRTFIVQFQDL